MAYPVCEAGDGPWNKIERNDARCRAWGHTERMLISCASVDAVRGVIKFQNLNWVASYLDEVKMVTLALGDLLGSFRGDDVSGLVRDPINARAIGDVGVVAVIPSLSQQTWRQRAPIPGRVSVCAVVRSPGCLCESGSTRRRYRSSCGARLSRARGTTGLRAWWSA